MRYTEQSASLNKIIQSLKTPYFPKVDRTKQTCTFIL